MRHRDVIAVGNAPVHVQLLLYVGRLDGTIVGSAQLVRPPRNNEAQAFSATLMHSFIAPYARGHGLARLLTARLERLGVARVSLGSGPIRATLGLLRRNTRELQDGGTYRALTEGTLSYQEANELFGRS